MTRSEYLKAANEAYSTGRVDEDEEEEDYEEGEKLPMKILKVEPGKKPEVIEMVDTLENLQEQVGGYIQVIYPFEDLVGIICNDESKLIGMKPNRALYDAEGNIYDIIAGPMLIAGLSEDSFESLSPELLKKYEAMFHTPEEFAKIGNKIIVFPVVEIDMEKRAFKRKADRTTQINTKAITSGKNAGSGKGIINVTSRNIIRSKGVPVRT